MFRRNPTKPIITLTLAFLLAFLAITSAFLLNLVHDLNRAETRRIEA